MTDFAIWWTSEQDCRAIGELNSLDNSPIADYIKRQFRSRYGRAGRGRLWVDSSIFDIEVDDLYWPEDYAVARKAEYCAGIVIYMEDVLTMKQFPGFITDKSFFVL